MVMKASIKMEHGAGGEGMQELLKLVLRYFNSKRGNNRVKYLHFCTVFNNSIITASSNRRKPFVSFAMFL